MLGESGIVLNPAKFQFASKTVDFAGFRISSDIIEPLPKYLDAIRNFPTPTSLTDIRSWFGLINQVSNYAQLRDLMAPFRDFLSPNFPFRWTDALNDTFNRSKQLIVEAIQQGVKIFDLTKRTCLRTDWSAKGIGYFLTQKHCDCSSRLPDCCEHGWVVTLAGSRFLSGAEKRYAAIEGEALAVAWSLKQSKYFTQGCPDLIVVTDHKPLVKLFGDRTLDEVDNTRLFRLKQRTLAWRFEIAYMPGNTNSAADAASRHPTLSACQSLAMIEDDEAEELMNAAIAKDLREAMTVTWDQMAVATKNDAVLATIIRHLEDGTTISEPMLSHYIRYRDSLYIHNNVVMYQDRVVVPELLRPAILQNLHSAHQGVSSMEQRAHSIVFWPGMTRDIRKVRSECYHCNRNAPSNAHLPSIATEPPKTPFEKIFGDFFSFGGNHYLVIGDRLSGWTEIFSTPTGSSQSGARGLITCLRSLFCTFGVPYELSSDGGPEFVSDMTRQFLKDWDVAHRISSAYNPESNGRAEVAVKSAKRVLRSNTLPSGSLDSDKFLRGMLQLRNTPDAGCSLSPAEVIFGHPLRDSFSFANRLEKFSNPAIRKTWRDAWSAKENALKIRFARTTEKMNEHTRDMPLLRVGAKVLVQNQNGNYPRRWDRSGVVTEVLPFDQYLVKIDGSWRVTRRNRRFLKVYVPVDTPSTPPAIPLNIPSDQMNDPLMEVRDAVTPQPTVAHEPVEPSSPHERFVTDEAEKLSDKPERLPAALRKLADYNNPGLQETAPIGRRRRK